jgi:hypothetical protein
VSDDSFTGRSSSPEIEYNPSTGRSVRRTAQKQVKYEESDEDADADAIEDTPDEDEEDSPAPRRGGTRAKSPEKKSLIVKLKMPKGQSASTGRALRARTGSKSTAMRGKTPEVPPTRRSSRLSHDVEEPIVALSDSGKHINIVRQGTRSPEPLPTRAIRGGKGPRVTEHPSTIIEVSQEASNPREDSPGPLDQLLGEDDPQVEASTEHSPQHEAQVQKQEEGEDEDMEGVVQESQNDAAAEDSEEEEGPITRGGRNLRVSLLPFRILRFMLTFAATRQVGQAEARCR